MRPVQRFDRPLDPLDGIKSQWPIAVVIAGWLAMYLPTYIWLAKTIWSTDEQGHGPIILGVSVFLLFRRREQLAAIDSARSPALGSVILAFGCLLYLLGRSQAIYILDVGSQLFVLVGILLVFKRPLVLKSAFFPIFFLIFMVPLPSGLVAALTAPLKLAVSAVATSILYLADFPIARSGVTLSIGQYQLLVADACAGLNSMFTLEALGLLYMNIMGYKSIGRNLWLAIFILPISFSANVIRVLILILVTFYFGDEAGQGFAHEFAGMVLFLIALSLILFVDHLLGAVLRPSSKEHHVAAAS